MTVDAEFPADLRAQLNALDDELEERQLALDVNDCAFHVANDIEAGRLVGTVQSWFEYEIGLGVRRGLDEQTAREAVTAGFQEIFGDDWRPS